MITDANVLRDTAGRDAGAEIDHPMINGDPNAILIVTQEALRTSSDYVLRTPGPAVVFEPTTSKWRIIFGYPDANSPNASLVGVRVNVMIVKR